MNNNTLKLWLNQFDFSREGGSGNNSSYSITQLIGYVYAVNADCQTESEFPNNGPFDMWSYDLCFPGVSPSRCTFTTKVDAESALRMAWAEIKEKGIEVT